MPATKPVINFAAGPAKLPRSVLEQAQAELIDFDNTGMSVMELSHRSKEFLRVIEGAEANIRKILTIPDNYEVMFLQGGATLHFAAIAMNFAGPEDTVDYLVTGTWSKKAAQEAQKYCKVNMVLPKTSSYSNIPPTSEWKLTPNAKYVYYCDNETVHGVEFPEVPETHGVPLVADMSSNFLSRPVDVSKFACIFGGAQKNIGPAGVTVVIVRKDMLGHAQPITPTMMDYAIMAENKSLYNTPPTFGIYMCGLVFKWILEHGGLEGMASLSERKSSLLYNLIDNSNGYYKCMVVAGAWSRMNVPFRLATEDFEAKFLKEAGAQGFVQLKGHRSVGGIRASLYNAITVDEVETLVSFMETFMKENPQ